MSKPFVLVVEDRIAASGFDGYLAGPISVREFPGQVRAFCAGAASA